MRRIKVFHVEDYKILRDGIKHLLLLDFDIEIVGEAKNGEDFFQALDASDIDVLILDLYLEGIEDLTTFNGFQICRIVQEKYPHIKIIAHSVFDDAERVASIMRSGALGFVSKRSGFEELVRAIKTVCTGSWYICPKTAAKLRNLNESLLVMDNRLQANDGMFSARELEVLELLSNGKSSTEIAVSLVITERIVESHRRNMIEKGKVKNTVELIAFASSLGVIKK
jgi:DNA-binding NarL/FixJ family response regulator